MEFLTQTSYGDWAEVSVWGSQASGKGPLSQRVWKSKFSVKFFPSIFSPNIGFFFQYISVSFAASSQASWKLGIFTLKKPNN